MRPAVHAVVLSFALGLSGCGGSSGGPGQTPTPLPPVVSGITPTAGSVSGNTVVTITGQNFAAGATVTVAGVAATDVTVSGTTRLTARTGARSAGSGDVVVSVAGMTGRLAEAFTYTVPGPSANPPPLIKALTAQGSRKNEPAGYADLGETVSLSATVTDAETPNDGLVFEWSATQGTLTGTGPSVTWKAPGEGTVPFAVTATLTVIERFVTNDTAVPEIRENRSVQTTMVDVHDGVTEVGGMATRFLENFSKSDVPTSVVMADFLPECYGTEEERDDVEDNRRESHDHVVVGRSAVGDRRFRRHVLLQIAPRRRVLQLRRALGVVRERYGRSRRRRGRRSGRGGVSRSEVVAVRQSIQRPSDWDVAADVRTADQVSPRRML